MRIFISLLLCCLALSFPNSRAISGEESLKLPAGFRAKEGASTDPESGLPVEIVCLKDGSEMVLIPAGEFIMGTGEEELAELSKKFQRSEKYFASEMPARKVYLSAFYIDKREITNAQFRRFVAETKGRASGTFGRFSGDDSPAVCVSWYDAEAYAKWAGKQLPTEAQWEKAARGVDGRLYPWGNEFDWSRCNSASYWAGKNLTPAEYTEWLGKGFKSASSTKAGSFETGRSPYGCYDMAGNVMEWCRDWFDRDYYRHAPTRDPQGPPTGEAKVVRGGSWGNYGRTLRCAARYSFNPRTRLPHIGFRCVLELKKSE